MRFTNFICGCFQLRQKDDRDRIRNLDRMPHLSFPLTVYMLALSASFLTSLITLPVWRKLCRRIGLVDDPGHRKIHKAPIVLAGGITIFMAMFLPLVIGIVLIRIDGTFLKQSQNLLTYGINRRHLELFAILAGALMITIVGLLDDRFELRPATKFAGQFVAAFVVAWGGARITLFVPNVIFSYGITVLWILTLVNAFNFMDNMNGLCSGLGAISAWFIAAIAALQGQYLVATISLLVCGALAGFLPYNFPKASAFLGDGGSHLTGFLIAVLAVLPHFYNKQNPNHWAVLTPLLILLVPLGDLVWVVIIRWRLGQPFYHGDNNHLSHRLVRNGFGKPAAVMLIWSLAILSGALALGLALWQHHRATAPLLPSLTAFFKLFGNG